MRNLIEKRFPYVLALFVAIILFSALVLEGNSHMEDNNINRESSLKCYNSNDYYKEQLAQKEEKIEELQNFINSLHLFNEK